MMMMMMMMMMRTNPICSTISPSTEDRLQFVEKDAAWSMGKCIFKHLLEPFLGLSNFPLDHIREVHSDETRLTRSCYCLCNHGLAGSWWSVSVIQTIHEIMRERWMDGWMDDKNTHKRTPLSGVIPNSSSCFRILRGHITTSSTRF
jgi:hypothetical protein